MELPELILQVLHSANNAVDYYTRGAHRPAAESLALISNKITKELPKIARQGTHVEGAQIHPGKDEDQRGARRGLEYARW